MRLPLTGSVVIFPGLDGLNIHFFKVRLQDQATVLDNEYGDQDNYKSQHEHTPKETKQPQQWNRSIMGPSNSCSKAGLQTIDGLNYCGCTKLEDTLITKRHQQLGSPNHSKRGWQRARMNLDLNH